MSQCPVCLNFYGTEAQTASSDGGLHVNCELCGRFTVTDVAFEDFLNPIGASGSQLSEMHRARIAYKLRSGNIDSASNRPLVKSDFLENFIREGCPGPSPSEQALNIVRFIGAEVTKAGNPLQWLPIDFHVVVGAPNRLFSLGIAKELIEQGVVSGTNGNDPRGPNLSNVNLTLKGWSQYDNLKNGQTVGRHGFIALKFGDAVLEELVAQIIKPAIQTGIGYALFDMRDVARAGVIDNIMRAQIRDAAFVLVDLTHDNSGAYWEAGYAEGLGKPVIYICERAKFDSVQTHFDTNHCTTVLWSDDRQQEFSDELIATLRRSLDLFEKI